MIRKSSKIVKLLKLKVMSSLITTLQNNALDRCVSDSLNNVFKYHSITYIHALALVRNNKEVFAVVPSGMVRITSENQLKCFDQFYIN
jgi:hypothetical protein